MNPLQFYRMLVVINGVVPLFLLAWDARNGRLGANPVNHALHITGILSLVFLYLSLLMTPLKWFNGWGGWIAFRRALGLYGFFYAVVHLLIYVGLDRALSLSSTIHEVTTRTFLQIGIVALLLMVPLAVTSTNGMIRRIGSRRWKMLHRLAYVAAVLGVVHYYMLVKSDVRQPLAFGAVLAVLLGSRFARHYYELRRASVKSTRAVTQSVAKSWTVASPRATPWKGELKIGAIFQETPDVKTFRLTTPDGGPFPFTHRPGQFLNIQLMIGGKRVNRSYTIASSPGRTDAVELTTKREPAGFASRFMHDELQVGDRIQVSGPAGKFVFTGHESSGVLLISGGVGITPNLSILRFLTDRSWAGDIYFVVVAKSEQDLICRDELRGLQRRFPNLRICETLTRCDPEDMWQGERGRLTGELLRRFVPDMTTLPVYLCGPNEMMAAAEEVLVGLGVPRDQIQTEAFAARRSGPHPERLTTESAGEVETTEGAPALIATAPCVITFSRSEVRANVTSESTVLEAAEALSIEIPYECRSGFCGQCKTRLLNGAVTMDCEDALSGSEKATGLILACQARPRSDLVVEA